MKTRLFPVLMVTVLLTVFATAAWAALGVKADKDNVVGSRLEGRWRCEDALTKRLTARNKPRGNIAFKSDPKVAHEIPEKYETFLAKKQIYMSGIMTSRGKSHPFVLIEHKGNPHVVYFRERDGDPMGDAESFNVMLAVARNKQNDLLFIGGDFNNQPFSAYEREKED